MSSRIPADKVRFVLFPLTSLFAIIVCGFFSASHIVQSKLLFFAWTGNVNTRKVCVHSYWIFHTRDYSTIRNRLRGFLWRPITDNLRPIDVQPSQTKRIHIWRTRYEFNNWTYKRSLFSTFFGNIQFRSNVWEFIECIASTLYSTHSWMYAFAIVQLWWY